MPRLSLYRPNRTNDYRFFDRTISEMYTVGGLDIYVHKYLGPKTGQEDSLESGNYDVTQPNYTSTDPLFIQDLLLLENRDRAYDPDVYRMRGVYNVQDIDFDLTQFGLFLQNDTLFITFHYNDMIDTIGRKLMSGDVLEVPNLRDMNPLDTTIPRALPRYYVVQDANFASEGFSQTWMPHLWRVKATPMVNAQEYQEIINKPFLPEQIWDPGNFYPAGTVVNYGDTYYRARIDTPVGTDITNNTYWQLLTDPPTEEDRASTRPKDLEINDAMLAQAEIDVPLSGYDTTKFWIMPTNADGSPADPTGITADGNTNSAPQTPLVTNQRYTTGEVTRGNSAPFSSYIGTQFPSAPDAGAYMLRTDYFPSLLYLYDGNEWLLQRLGNAETLTYTVTTVPQMPLISSTVIEGSSENGNTEGSLAGDQVSINSEIPPEGLSVAPGVSFPADAVEGQYCLRLDYFPNRLFRYDGRNWLLQELSNTDSLVYTVTTSPDSETTGNATITVDSTYINTSEAAVSPRADGYTLGYLTGDGVPPNGLPVTPGVTFPLNPTNGQYCLRLDYFPNRLFRYDGRRWLRIEDNVRTNLTNGPQNNTLRSTFVNNTYTVPTTDQGNIPSRQSLSELLRPRADNGNDGGDKPSRPYPPTAPGKPSS